MPTWYFFGTVDAKVVGVIGRGRRMTSGRLDKIEDELETAKRLLVSAASYAESANQRLDRLTVTVEGISQKVDELTTAQVHTQRQIDELAATQTQTQAQLNHLSEKVDEFVFQAQRLFTQNAERLIRVEGQTERLEAIVQLLNRNYTAQQSQLQEFQLTTNAALERIDRVLDYLLRQQGEGR